MYNKLFGKHKRQLNLTKHSHQPKLKHTQMNQCTPHSTFDSHSPRTTNRCPPIWHRFQPNSTLTCKTSPNHHFYGLTRWPKDALCELFPRKLTRGRVARENHGAIRPGTKFGRNSILVPDRNEKQNNTRLNPFNIIHALNWNILRWTNARRTRYLTRYRLEPPIGAPRLGLVSDQTRRWRAYIYDSWFTHHIKLFLCHSHSS